MLLDLIPFLGRQAFLTWHNLWKETSCTLENYKVLVILPAKVYNLFVWLLALTISLCIFQKLMERTVPRLKDRTWSCSCTVRGRHKTPLGRTATGLAVKVGEMLSSSVSSSPLTLVGHRARNLSGSSSNLNLSRDVVQRSLVLFVVGTFLALVLNLLQIQRNVTLFPEEVMATVFSSAWWVPPCCGTAAGESPRWPRAA